uniref:Internal virion protein n=1 Tax=viral metagenome TaxID=1070528 RepID=A0A6M3K7L0_9ZZZZ
MPVMPVAILALGAAQAGASIMSGISQNREAKYNAGLMEQQAGLLEQKKGLVDIQAGQEAYQYGRAKTKMMGTLTSRVAKSGLMLSGSPLAVMMDNLTQMQLDESIGQYNFQLEKYNIDVEKSRALSTAEAYRRQGKTALYQGYSGAFTSALQTGVNYGIYTGMPKATTLKTGK